MAELLGVQGNAWSGTPLPRVFVASEIRHGAGTNRRSLRMPSDRQLGRDCRTASVATGFRCGVRCLSAVIRLAMLGKVGPRLAGNMPGRMSVCCHEKLLPVLTCCRAIGCDELSARLYFLIFLFVV